MVQNTGGGKIHKNWVAAPSLSYPCTDRISSIVLIDTLPSYVQAGSWLSCAMDRAPEADVRCGLRELIGNRISRLATLPLLSFYSIRGVYAIVGLHARHLINPGVLIAGLPVVSISMYVYCRLVG